MEKYMKSHEFLAGYHLKSRNRHKRDNTKKYHSNIVQAHLSQI